MALIPDYGFPRSNVAPCLLSLRYYGDLISEDSTSCQTLLATLCGCGQSWAREALARSLSPHAEAFLQKPWGVVILDVAICYSPELCCAVQGALARQAHREFSEMDNETLYRTGWMSMRMAAMAMFPEDIICMHEILTKMSLRLNTLAAGEILRARDAVSTQARARETASASAGCA